MDEEEMDIEEIMGNSRDDDNAMRPENTAGNGTTVFQKLRVRMK